jgi:PAS domain S-box-containing protein
VNRAKGNCGRTCFALITEFLMTSGNQILDPAADLRRQAEEAAALLPEDVAALSPGAMRRTLHELRVHQIELEMQNDELRLAQAHLDAARERYFDLYNLAPVGYVSLDEQGLILEANLAAATLLGVARCALVTRRLPQFILPDDQDIYYRHLKQLLATGEPQTCELRLLSPTGTPGWVRLDATAAQAPATSPERAEGGTPVCRIVLSDISTHKRDEDELARSAARFRSYFDLPLHGIAITSPSKGWVDVNQRLCSMLGYPRDEITRLTWSEMTHPDDLAADVTQFERLLAGQIDQYQLEKRFTRKNGTVIWTHLAVGCVRHADGRMEYAVALLHDVSARKQAEADRDRLEALDRQLHKSDSLNRMAGGIAHHFNNQLMVVMGNLELAMDDLLLRGANPLAALNAAMQASRRAAEVSSLMLTYLGQTPTAPALMDLCKSCRQNLPILSAGMPKSVVLETDLPVPGPAICANSSQIQQVLANLLSNAWEATSAKGGTTRLAVSTVVAADIPSVNRFPIGCQPQDPAYACLAVADTGGGIASRDIEKLFDPFFSTKFTGRGLGLPVVLGIVRAHGGFITVDSQLDHGCVFRVFLPLAMPAPNGPVTSATAVAEADPPASRAPEGTVLLVEDDAAVRNVAASMLTRLGFAVLVAPDGSQALELFRQRQADIRCVLCDLTMQHMDGWATLTALRQLAPGLRVILASGYDEALVMAGDHPERPQAFLGKPYQMQALRTAMEKALASE